MDTSIFLARLIGPLLLVIAAGLLLRQTSWRPMASDFLANRALVYLTGFLALLAGLAIVNTHNVWVAHWPVIITILGWMAVIGGIFRMLWPERVIGIGERMLSNASAITAIGVIEGLIGLWLTYAGYLA